MGVQSIHGKESHSLFRDGSEAATGNIIVLGTLKQPKLLRNIYSIYTYSIYVAAGRIIQPGAPLVAD